MTLLQAFGIHKNKINWKHPLSIGIGLVFPHILLICFILVVGRLILQEKSGIFSDELIYNSLLEIICYTILTISLVLILYYIRVNLFISITLAAIICRIPDIITGYYTTTSIILNIITIVLFLIIFQSILKTEKSPPVGLIMSFLIAILISRIISNLIYIIHVYRHFGKEAILNNVENGEILNKLGRDIMTGLILTLFVMIGYLISRKMLLKQDTHGS